MRVLASIDNGRKTLQNDLQNFFIAEVLAAQVVPDYHLWLISPWMENLFFPLPATGVHETLFPEQDALSLLETCRKLTGFGGVIHIVTRYNDRDFGNPTTLRTREFVQQLQSLSPGRVEVKAFTDLHAKLIVGHYGALVGSMNLTGYGLANNKELLLSFQDPEEIKALRRTARRIFDSKENVCAF